MSELRDRIINEIIDREGGFVDNPSDSGGPTKYGVTEEVARICGFKGHMRDLPRSMAFDLYGMRYWDALKLDNIEKVSPIIGEELADQAVNMGIGRAGSFLQRSLNALNRRGEDYDDLKVDAMVGVRTIRTFNEFMICRPDIGEVILMRALNCLQGAYYIELCERREKDEEFLAGWLLNRVE